MIEMFPEVGGILTLVGGLPFGGSVGREEGLRLVVEFFSLDLDVEDLGVARVIGSQRERIERGRQGGRNGG